MKVILSYLSYVVLLLRLYYFFIKVTFDLITFYLKLL